MRNIFQFIVIAIIALLSGCQEKRVESMPASYPQPKQVAVDQGLSAAAKKEVAQDLASPDPEVRAHAIETVRLTASQDHAPDIIRGLGDAQPIIRFASALAAGEMRLADAHAPLLAIAEDADESVRVAVRFALHRLGDTHLSHQLEGMARDPNPAVRGNTAMVLGLLGEPSALRVLRIMRRDPNPAVRQQASEAMWRLHDEDGLQDLIALSLSKYPDDEMIGLLGLSEPRDTRIRQHVRNGLTAEWPEVTLVAARAMGMLGSDEGYGIASQGAHSTDWRQRQLAAFAFGAIGRADAQDALRKLLGDDNPNVRLAAATAVLQLKPASVAQR
jgi:HEAT repeat protein